MNTPPAEAALTRRDVLKVSGAALAAAAVAPHLAPAPVQAQTPKRGGVLRMCNLLDAVGFDPHQTTRSHEIPLSFNTAACSSEAGPSIKPGLSIEDDLARRVERERLTYSSSSEGRAVHSKPRSRARADAEDVPTLNRLSTPENGNRPTRRWSRVERPTQTVRFR